MTIRHNLRPSALLLALISSLLVLSCSQRQNPHELSQNLQEKDKIMWKATFEDLDGNQVKLEDYKGKVVLFDFWETWCGPCLIVFPTMDSLMREYPDDFAVLTVNLLGSDEVEDVASFKGENPYEFTYLLDSYEVGPEVIDYGIPYKMFFDPDGYLVNVETGTAGPEGDYRKAKAIIEKYKK